MKKSLATASVLVALLPASVLAAPSQQGSFSYNGAYGGLGLGFSSITNHLETGFEQADEGSTNFAYDAYAGYGVMFNGPWYAGGEIGIGDTTGSSKINSNSLNAKITPDYLFNADLRAGRVFEQSTLAYAKLGWAHTQFDQNVNGGSDDTSYDGIRFGAGAETVLSSNVTGRLEAVYTDYDSQTVNGVKFSPNDVAVMFGVSYYFY